MANGSSIIHTEHARIRALPANITFLDLIRRNKRKSIVLVIGMALLGVALGSGLAVMLAAWGGGGAEVLLPSLVLGGAAAAVVVAGASLWSFYGGSEAILKMSGATPIEKQHDPQLFNVVEELSIAAGVPMPRVYLINDDALNAFATGRDPAHGAVAITTGLRRQLSRDELAGVMAHELSHIRYYDIRFAMLMATMVGLIVFACDAFWRVLFYGRFSGGARRSGGGKGNAAMAIVMVVAVVLAIIAPMLAMLIRFAVSRQREYLADAGAVELTRYPPGLIGAPGEARRLQGAAEGGEPRDRAPVHRQPAAQRHAWQGPRDLQRLPDPPAAARPDRPSQGADAVAMVPLLVIAGIVLVGVVGYFAWLVEKKRREALAALAAQLGFRFDPSRDRDHDDEYAHFEIFRRGHSRAAHNTLSGELEIDGRRWPAKMGDFTYKITQHSGKSTSTQTYRFSYLILHMPWPDVPDLLIRREGMFDKIAGALGFDDIDFESAQFSRLFHVSSADKRFAYDVIDPRMMEFLLAGDPPTVDIENARCCISDGRRRWEPAEFRGRLAWITEFMDRWPEHVLATLQT